MAPSVQWGGERGTLGRGEGDFKGCIDRPFVDRRPVVYPFGGAMGILERCWVDSTGDLSRLEGG